MAEVFPTSSVGVVTARDKLAIRWTSNEMKQVAADFASLSEEDARTRYDLGDDVQDWKVQWAQADVRTHPYADKHIEPILYRPFDRRWTFYTGQSRGFVCRPRSEVMNHMLAGSNVGLCIGRAGQVIGAKTWDLCFLSESLSGLQLVQTRRQLPIPSLHLSHPSARASRLGPRAKSREEDCRDYSFLTGTRLYF